MLGIGVLCVWSKVDGSRLVHELWHVDQCDVRTVAMIIFRASRENYIRRVGHVRGAFAQSVLCS